MQAFLILFGLAWGVSPFLLGWGLLALRDKARQLEAANRLLSGQVGQKKAFEEEVSRLNVQLNVQGESIEALGKRLVKDNSKFISAKLTANNYATSKKSLESVFAFCEKNGFYVSEAEQNSSVRTLKEQFEKAVKAQWEREEQARIRRQIREEQKLEAERQRELQRLENQELAAETALQKALQKAHDEHDAEVTRLRALLAEAQSKLERAKSMAQLTKAGFVYVISNVGAFGDNMFKIGMTRRLEPLDRVRELGDASVPFPYDVHMMISADDAPSLEAALHRELHTVRVNRVNPRREFFRVDIDTIARLVERYHGNVDYVPTPEALEYNESLSMSEEDFEYVAQQVAKFDEDEEGYSDAVALKKGDERIARPAAIGDVPKPVPGKIERGEASEAATGEATEAVQNRLTAKCPRCKGVLFIDALVDGDNVCPHCQQSFRVKR